MCAADDLKYRRDPTKLCNEDCIYKKILSIIGKKHTLDIIRILGIGTSARFNVLQRQIRGSPKTLTDRLSELCAIGILKREAFAEIPPRVEYTLTEKGMDLNPVMDELKRWAEKWGDFP